MFDYRIASNKRPTSNKRPPFFSYYFINAPFDLITDSDVDEADNSVFWIEEDDEIIDVDIEL